MADPQDIVAQFIAVTDCEAAQAEQYLDAHNWDLNAAVETYMAVENVNANTAKTARELHEDADGVRAPDAVKRQRLIDPPQSEVAGPYTYAPAYDTRRTATSRSVFATAAPAQPEATNARTQRLNDLYRLPTDLMFTGDLFQAREVAKARKKWLLVVIHRDDVFESHIFNRDVWSNSSVIDTVNSAFVFWLQHHTSPEGAKFVQRYLVDSFPYIAILDPRTAAKIWSYQGPANADEFLDKVYEFLTDRPITELFGDDVSPSSTAAAATSSTASALGVESTANSTSLQQRAAAGDSAPSTQLPTTETRAGFSRDDVSDSVEEEPDATAENTTRIQIKLPGGDRKVRRFSLNSSVKAIVQYVLSELPEEFRTDSSKRFDVLTSYPARSLTTLVDRTIGEANIKGESLTVRWVE